MRFARLNAFGYNVRLNGFAPTPMDRCRGGAFGSKKNGNEVFIKKTVFKNCYIGVGVNSCEKRELFY
jgi:hypothetical protein